MAFAGLIFIGVLFGLMLSAIAVGFVVVRSGGPLKESLFGDSAAGRPRFSAPAVPAPTASPDLDRRYRAVVEELRVTQKFVDQARGEREQHEAAARAAADEIAQLNAVLAERNDEVAALQSAAVEAASRAEDLNSQLSARLHELATVGAQLREARTELEVTESGAAMTTAQIESLQRERNQLAALVEQLQERAATVTEPV